MVTADKPASAPDADTDPRVRASYAVLVGEVGAEAVGEHVSATAEASGSRTDYFASAQPGYPGWRWSVTTAQPEGQEEVTLDELVLLPGEEAIVAPVWVPWRERIQPGDLSPGDLLPADEDDPRLVPGYLAGEDTEDRTLGMAVAAEVGLGRARVLSLEGRDLAAQRWYDGDQGPQAPLAQSAPARCGSCGFLVRVGGPLGLTFGVCANEFANDDARIVSLDHGCGAHSEAQLRKKQLPSPLPDPVHDDLTRGDLEDF